jgi:hypothetical protein
VETKAKLFISLILSLYCLSSTFSQTDSTLNIFQFPADKIPRIDGDKDYWSFVHGGYIIGNEQLRDDEKTSRSS